MKRIVVTGFTSVSMLQMIRLMMCTHPLGDGCLAALLGCRDWRNWRFHGDRGPVTPGLRNAVVPANSVADTVQISGNGCVSYPA